MKILVSRWRLLIAAGVLAMGVALAMPSSADDLGKLFKKTESGKSKSDDRSKNENRSAPSVSPSKNDNNTDDNNLFRKKDDRSPAPVPTRQPTAPTRSSGNRPQPSERNLPPVGPGEYWVHPPEVETPFGNRPRPSSSGLINLARRTGEWQPKIYFPPINDTYRRHYPRGVAYGFYVRVYEPYQACPSVYVFYPTMPAYISTERIVVAEQPVFVEVPVFVYRDSYYLERNLPTRLDATIGDIQRAWRYNSPDLIRRHLRFDMFVAVYLRGKYAYSIPAEDYFIMTLDAMRNTRTVRFAFDEIRRRTSDIYVLYGQHVYEDEDGQLRTTYISYTLERMGSEWIITEVGSSPEPIVH
ncbi:MAG: hypothetical protein ACUVR7_08335 [Armatimonadota bacterium]